MYYTGPMRLSLLDRFEKNRYWVWGVFSALALLYVLNAGYYFVGIFNDDARHVLAARALLEGHYNDLSMPFKVPATNLLPGYPLLLMLPEALGGFWGGHLLSILFSCLSVGLLWQVLGREERAAAVLFALHPSFVRLSSALMTEPAYLFWCLFSLVWLARLKHTHLLWFSAWLAFSAWIRPHGGLLLLGLMPFALRQARSKSDAWKAVVVAGGICALPYLRNLLVAGVPASYFNEFPRSSGFVGALGSLQSSIAANLGFYFTAVPQMLVPVSPLYGGVLGYLVCAGVWFLLIVGFGTMWTDEKDAAARPRLVYVFLVAALSLLWVNHATRYVLILLPFLYEWLLRSLRAKPYWRKNFLIAVIAAGSIFQTLDGTRRVLGGQSPAYLAPSEALAWAKEHTKPTDIFSAPYRQYVYLHTGRKTLNYFYYADPDAFYEYVLRTRITHIWADRSRLRIASTPQRRAELDLHQHTMEARIQDSNRFRRVYANEREKIAIFEVIPSEDFLLGRALLAPIRAKLARGEWDDALSDLKGLEKDGAPLYRLDFLIGTTALMTGRHTEAQRHLKAALGREPGFAIARENLCRSYRSTGKGARVQKLCGK